MPAERTPIIPAVNAEEACLASGLRVIAVNHLLELVAHFNGRTVIAPYQSSGLLHQPKPYPDLSEVQGQTAGRPSVRW
ncbi:Mg-chelatase subunits D/I family, ComM sub protein [Pseudomonas coronafaciens pv. coronafaciens]|nr:Mg-chelatase subunits D/I family, ComM sub protein [Pseudomonas coronafaciens pv. atropurpurea]RMS08937.1 Mg-chelatase subunits D/I family, ComM sub protein [Pseudomonas coronafaciens pv. coronafaciens]